MKPWIIMGNGRIGRLGLIAHWTWLYLAAFPLILYVGLGAMFGGTAVLLAWVLYMAFLAINIMIAVRRLHDMNRSGWWALILIIVIPAISATVMNPSGLLSQWYGWNLFGYIRGFEVLTMVIFPLILMAVPGSKDDNRFGPPPSPNSGSLVAGLILAILSPLVVWGIVALLYR